MRNLMLLCFEDGRKRKFVISDKVWDDYHCQNGIYGKPFSVPVSLLVENIEESVLGEAAKIQHGPIIAIVLYRDIDSETIGEMPSHLLHVLDLFRIASLDPRFKEIFEKTPETDSEEETT